MKTCKRCKRSFKPDKSNRLLCEYCRSGKSDVESIHTFMHKLNRYNEKHGTNISYGKAQELLFFEKINL